MNKLAACVVLASTTVQAQTVPYVADERDLYHEAHVYHVMLRTEAEAKEAFASLRNVPSERLLPTFKEAAVAKSIDPGSSRAGGDLGVIKEGTMVRSFEKAAFSTAPGHMSGPVQSEFGWHLVYVASAKSTPVARICDQTLQAHLKGPPAVPARAIELTKRNKPGTPGFDDKVRQVLGPLWGPALKDADGNTTFLKVGGINASGNKEVLQHTEYPHARLHIAPMACKRSERVRYEVNCREGTVQLQAIEELEFRGGQGPVVNRRAVTPRLDVDKSQYGGFYRQLRDSACNKADLKT
ncbi:peptidylprolyl isomerase [Variovorax paradoxus]|uniref:peptidylprolyl isomerase n=1 Tax=Variovorax paradoxus TaxID=34073 RepID=UPI001ABCAEF8